MSRNGKVLVAMSGGVDSSVAACLLRDAGYDCVGVFMRVGAEPPEQPSCSLDTSHPPRRLKHGCCSATDAVDARAVAARLGIPFYALNFRDDFGRIIDYFVDEYAQARTPNPCILCNIHLKFGKLLRYAEMIDAACVATGHYARIVEAADGAAPRLARAANLAKDQSYVLFGIRREDLARCLFPLGEVPDKRDVRRIAAALGLRVHDKPDSQEICFVPDQDYRRLVYERRPELRRPGHIRDAAGRPIGTHDGLPGFTIGQRRGLGVAVGRPVYVTQLNVLDNSVTVGSHDELLAAGLVADQLNWLSDPPPPGTRRRVTAKIRHTHTPAPGELLIRHDDSVELRFDEPQLAVTPGQAAVFYDGELVLAGGWIRSAVSV